jgi:hypothetical protein
VGFRLSFYALVLSVGLLAAMGSRLIDQNGKDSGPSPGLSLVSAAPLAGDNSGGADNDEVAPSAAAVEEPGLVTIEACVVRRNPTSALMRAVFDGVLFELDLRGIPDTPFALQPDECVLVHGRNRDNQPGLRREFVEGLFLVEARLIEDGPTHLNPPQVEDEDEDD